MQLLITWLAFLGFSEATRQGSQVFGDWTVESAISIELRQDGEIVDVAHSDSPVEMVLTVQLTNADALIGGWIEVEAGYERLGYEDFSGSSELTIATKERPTITGDGAYTITLPGVHLVPGIFRVAAWYRLVNAKGTVVGAGFAIGAGTPPTAPDAFNVKPADLVVKPSLEGTHPSVGPIQLQGSQGALQEGVLLQHDPEASLTVKVKVVLPPEVAQVARELRGYLARDFQGGPIEDEADLQFEPVPLVDNQEVYELRIAPSELEGLTPGVHQVAAFIELRGDDKLLIGSAAGEWRPIFVIERELAWSLCGNFLMEDDEGCDGTDFGDKTCAGEGLGTGGQLKCETVTCALITKACAPAGCDGVALDPDLGEECDGEHLGTRTCADDGYEHGEIACDDHCRYDTSGCYNKCGDGIVQWNEACDFVDESGNSLNGQTTCGCDANCQYPEKGGACDDGLQCSVGDYCNGYGKCLAGSETTCAKGEVCTEKGCVSDEPVALCGNGNLDSKEACDLGPDGGFQYQDGKDTCEAWGRGGGELSCTMPPQSEKSAAPTGCTIDFGKCSCGDGQLDSDRGEQCDDGWENGTPSSCCTVGCAFSDASTGCDDGDFCTATDVCDGGGKCEGSGATCPGMFCDSKVGRCHQCGDGLEQPGEACDHGANDNGATPCSCTSDCQLSSVCGAGEHCQLDDTVPAGYACEPACGNGIVDFDQGEICDGANTGLGYMCMMGSFVPTCAADCRSVTSPDPGLMCWPVGVSCGNNVRSADEACDGTDLGGVDCAYRGITGGKLACNADCTFDWSGCETPIEPACNNDVAEPGEACDGEDLRGQTCVKFGYAKGELACNDACNLDFSMCSMCGDGVLQGKYGEQCDLGFDESGQSLNGTSACGCDASCKLPTGETTCSDGRDCTEDDRCDGAGQCSSGASTCASGEVCRKGGCVALCGNGVPDGDEECDLGPDENGVSLNGTSTCGCDAHCKLPTIETLCDDGLACTGADRCDGAGQCSSGASTCASGEVCRKGGCVTLCGNMLWDRKEEACDASANVEANTIRCADLGYRAEAGYGNPNTLLVPYNDCTERCEWDTTPCHCGDGIWQEGLEACDASVAGFDKGCCTDRCALAPSGTTCKDGDPSTINDQCDGVTAICAGAPSCPNGTIDFELGEQCEGDDLHGQDCASLNHEDGTLACGQDCMFDVSQCGPKCPPGGCPPDDECSAEQPCPTGSICQEQTVVAEGGGYSWFACVSHCNNGLLESDKEDCEKGNLDGQSCLSQGRDGGTLACDPVTCRFDFSECGAVLCGNDAVDALGEYVEACDGGNLNEESCESLGFTEGELACADCRFDTNGCSICGDGKVRGVEECDGSVPDATTCQSEGFDVGTVVCGADCRLDKSACSRCGDGVVSGLEQCEPGEDDGDDPCACTATCRWPGVGTGDGGAKVPCDDGLANTCVSYCREGQCGTTERDTAFVCPASQVCSLVAGKGSELSAVCTRTCNLDGHLDPGEQCDGQDLGGAECDDLGQSGGVLACGSDCTFDVTGCFDVPVCGDQVTEGIEECDPPSEDACGCTELCKFADSGTHCDSTATVCSLEVCDGLGACVGSEQSPCALDEVCSEELGCTLCGNFQVDQGEVCDFVYRGSVGGIVSVVAAGPGIEAGCGGYDPTYNHGSVGCDSCQLVTTDCSTCGNGVKEGSEPCDGPLEAEDAECSQFPEFISGTLFCDECRVDTTECETGAICGDLVLHMTEECDGELFQDGTNTCEALGFDHGVLACSDCGLDKSGCYNDECGDGTWDKEEPCDPGVRACCTATCQLDSLGDCGPDAGDFACTEAASCEDAEGGEVLVSADAVWMGCSRDTQWQCEQSGGETGPRVTLSDFAIDKREVSAADYLACVEVGPCTLPEEGLDSVAAEAFATANLPIVFVSWDQARDYCEWDAKLAGAQRLCTEAEWELAARGGCDAQRRACADHMPLFPTGDAVPDCEQSNYYFHVESRFCEDEHQEFGRLAPVDARPGSASPYGALNMAGNVFEWVADWYAPYDPNTELTDPVGPETGTMRVMRGGSAWSDALSANAISRRHEPPDMSFEDVGFRCCRTLP